MMWSGIGVLVEAVGEEVPGGLFCLATVGPHDELGWGG